MNKPLATGTYECSTIALRAIEARMEAGEDITWGDELTDEQETCLLFIMEELFRTTPEGLDPADVFAAMIDHDGTFVVELDVDNLTAEIDFRHDNDATEGTES